MMFNVSNLIFFFLIFDKKILFSFFDSKIETLYLLLRKSKIFKVN
jgi:hypothetical protein